MDCFLLFFTVKNNQPLGQRYEIESWQEMTFQKRLNISISPNFDYHLPYVFILIQIMNIGCSYKVNNMLYYMYLYLVQVLYYISYNLP